MRKVHVRVKGDEARAEAEIIAMAASMGLITTRISAGVYGASWMITAAGCRWLGESEEEE